MDRDKMRVTFDEDALLYDQARPTYPRELFDDIVSFAALPAQANILEIGTGTGKATLPFAEQGHHILGIELGSNLAALARHNLSHYPNTTISTGNFEDFPLSDATFDLAFSATAFHWIDPIIKYQKVAQALKPTGTLALFWNIHVQNHSDQGFFEASQPLYQRYSPEQAQKTDIFLWPDEVPETVKAEIEHTGLFGSVSVRRYVWTQTYDAASYIRLLSTYSDHRIQTESQRHTLFQAITDLINTRYNGQITKGYLSILYLARKASLT